MYYQVDNEEQLTREFMKFTDEANEVNLYHCKEAMTGEDFGYMLKEIPGFMFWLGVQSTMVLHHAKINPNEDAIELAIEHLVNYLHIKAIII